MGIAVLMIGLVFSIGLIFQSLTVNVGGGLTNPDSLGGLPQPMSSWHYFGFSAAR